MSCANTGQTGDRAPQFADHGHTAKPAEGDRRQDAMPDGYAHLRINHGYEAWFKAHQGEKVRKVTEAVAMDARAGCPVDSEDLVDSIGTRYPGELRGILVVGTNHWAETEYGSPPHVIASHGPWSLRSDEGEYFGPIVHHPGTPAQPFLRPALHQKRRL